MMQVDRHILLLFVVLFAMVPRTFAQTVTSTVLVIDSMDGRPVPEVVITVDGTTQARTDAKGEAKLHWERRGATIQLEHIGYVSRELNIVHIGSEEGRRIIQLMPKDHRLGEVSVERARPEVVFQREDLHAADLLINDAGLWVLAYEQPRMVRAEADASKEILRHVRLVLLDTAFVERASCPVPEDVFGLRHDLRNDVVIEGTQHAFGVGRIGADIALRPFALDELRHSVLPWTDSIPGWILGSNAEPTYPALDLLAFDPRQDSTRIICSVVDTFMLDLFRSGYKYMKGSDKVVAMNLAAQLGVDKETVAGYMTGFSSNIWYRPIYAPMFVVDDTLLVFDHTRSMLRKFTLDFDAMGDVPLFYLAKEEAKAWSGKLVQDRATRDVYAIFQRNGITWLCRVDPSTGRSGDRFRLSGTYPERVQVHAGKVYYIWRPWGSMQKRTIYREKL